MRQQTVGIWNAVASAGLYANNLYLAPDREHKHTIITQFLQARCSSWRPTNGVIALKAPLPLYGHNTEQPATADTTS